MSVKNESEEDPDSEDSRDSMSNTYTTTTSSGRTVKSRTNFTNALLKVGTKSTKDVSLDKPVRKGPGLLLEAAGRSLLQKASGGSSSSSHHAGSSLSFGTLDRSSSHSDIFSNNGSSGSIGFGFGKNQDKWIKLASKLNFLMHFQLRQRSHLAFMEDIYPSTTENTQNQTSHLSAIPMTLMSQDPRTVTLKPCLVRVHRKCLGKKSFLIGVVNFSRKISTIEPTPTKFWRKWIWTSKTILRQTEKTIRLLPLDSDQWWPKLPKLPKVDRLSDLLKTLKLIRVLAKGSSLVF